MYYRKESQGIDNDYYNIYAKHSNRESERNALLTTIIKILAIIFLLISIIFGYIFVSNQYYLSQIQAKKMEQLKKRTYLKDVEQAIEATSSGGGDLEKGELSREEITQIVQMVMLKMKKIGEDNVNKTPIKEDRVEIKAIQQPKGIIVGTIDTTSEITIESSEKNSRDNNMRVIVVKEGDTLSTIASRVYGNVSAYKKIYKANPEVIKNENKIFTGQKIRLPQ